MVPAQSSRTRRSSHYRSSLGTLQTLVSQPPILGLSWTKYRTGCRDFQAGRTEVKVLVYSKVNMEKQTLTSEDISKIVDGFDPIDWVQMKLLAKMPFEKRLIPGLNAQEFAMSALRGTFQKKFPELTMPEINMKVLAYLTPVRMEIK